MQRYRAKKVLAGMAVLIGIGIVYASICFVTDIGIPCMFRQITGFKCPGCGVTHMCLALLQLDFKKAWQSNPAILCMLPLGLFLTIYTICTYIKKGCMPDKWWYNVIIWIMVSVLLIFGVVRNIEVPFLSFL